MQIGNEMFQREASAECRRNVTWYNMSANKVTSKLTASELQHILHHGTGLCRRNLCLGREYNRPFPPKHGKTGASAQAPAAVEARMISMSFLDLLCDNVLSRSLERKPGKCVHYC